MSVVVYITVILSFVGAIKECPQNSFCTRNDASIRSIMQVDDYYFYIAGVFAVHNSETNSRTCGTVSELGLQNLEMFFFSIDKFLKQFNKRHNTSINIGAIVFDSCSKEAWTIEKIMTLENCHVTYRDKTNRIDPRYILGYVGSGMNKDSIAMAHILSDLKKVQISYGATSSYLSDIQKFPYFLRTIPSNENEILAILEIMKSLKFRHTLLVYSDNSNGERLYAKFVEHSKTYNICTVKAWALPSDSYNSVHYNNLIDELTNYKKVYALVIVADERQVNDFLAQLKSNKLQGTFALFAISSWGAKLSIVKENKDIVNGAVSVERRPYFNVNVNEFEHYFRSLNPNQTRNLWFTEYWQDKFKCNIGSGLKYTKQCDRNIKISSFIQDASNEYIYLAVNSLLEGITNATENLCKSKTICGSFLNNENNVESIASFTKNFTYNKERIFDKRGDTDSWIYAIHNIVNNDYIEIGQYTSKKKLSLKEEILDYRERPYSRGTACPYDQFCCESTKPANVVLTQPSTGITKSSLLTHNHHPILFDNNSQITGLNRISERPTTEYRTRFDLNQNWIIALGVLAGVGILIVIALEFYIIYKIVADRPTRQLRSVWLGQLLMLGIALGYLTLFAFIPEPTDATCGITRIGIGISYAIIFSVLLVKLMIITTSPANNDYPFGRNDTHLHTSYQLLMFLFAVAVQIVIDVQWLITVPPQAVKVRTLNNEESWICNHFTWTVGYGYRNMQYFVRTEFDNHVISLVYIMFLILVTTVIALKSHGIQTNHKESVFIGISAGFSIPIWLSWSLIAHFNKNHPYAHQYGDACIAFGLLITITVILAAMFIPKITQLKSLGEENIYLEDEIDAAYANGSVYGVPPSYRSKHGPGSVAYISNDQIYSEPLSFLDPKANYLKYPKTTNSVHSLPAYVRRPESVYTGSGSTMKRVMVTPDLTGKVRKAYSEFGTTKSNQSYKSSNLKKARSTQDIGAL